MVNNKPLDVQESWAAIVDLKNAYSVIKLLKEMNLVNPNLKIKKDTVQLYIPVIKNDESMVDIPNIKEIKKSNFQVIHHKPKSLKEYLVKKIPPEFIDIIPIAFDQIGSIAVIDLDEDFVQFKNHVAAGIITIHPSVKSVFRKSSKVQGIHRIRKLEHIGGVNVTRTLHREYGLTFDIDISKSYFSPRLSTEHRRIAELVDEGEMVLDMFTGVGAFAFHITQLCNASVHCFDINPETENAIENSLRYNNKLQGTIAYQIGDAKYLSAKFSESGKVFDRIIMNHPSNSYGFFESADMILKHLGIIHLYVFMGEDDMEQFLEKITTEFPSFQVIETHRVRQSSPSEFHMCITLKKVNTT